MRLTLERLDLLIAAVRKILPLQAPADVLLRQFFQDRPQLGQNDRNAIAETVFGVLRHRFFLEVLAEKGTARKLVLAYLTRFQGMNLRELTPLIREAESKWIQQIKAVRLEEQPLFIQAEFPEWLVTKLQQSWSDEDILRLGQVLQQPAPLDIRVNSLLVKREEIIVALKQEGIEAHPTPFSPVGMRLTGKPAINRSALFLSGKIEVQDEGSQILGFLLAPKRGEMVVDFCAGAGGKTLLLGALMHSRGRLYAFDVSEKRLNNLKPRLKRSGLSNVHPQRIDSEKDIKLKRLAGKIDRVLVDAPCSGLGTLRRNPDLKWRQSPDSINELQKKQTAILTAAAKLLKPGGRLVYATCSLLPEENQQVIEYFLAHHPQFSILDCGELLAQQKIHLPDTGEFLQLSPLHHNTDGFFAAALERSKIEPGN
ncbi:RsmB/NOP family class I SAM-dependent RNA methyltransferase [Nitrosomonas sp. HPC101]|uniref:RsmB/NOP family class I SAM-dependent RNA methyltransferase n=1 Tax=Nitrosomonas sp. HPC101 TaxID=1658667 RepID=UPI00136900B8|nr:RsmB/NOP family class I SAM-dependent RNA methyltransferase [Nitrosomonas sp. HPC101]MXS85668.1 RsmB/NOP family class I SAM-dependent RNA methyltransferase [Nitrosomonas sp. HPC101]